MNPKNPQNQKQTHTKKRKKKSETHYNLYLCHEKKGIPQKEMQKAQPQNAPALRELQRKVGEEEAQSNNWKLEKVKGKVKRREV